MSSYNREPTISLYGSQSKFKWWVLGVSLVISAGSVIYTNQLVDKIRDRERKQIDLYARTLEYLANEQYGPNINFLLEEVVQANNTIPVVLTDGEGEPGEYRNLPEADKISDPEKLRIFLLNEVEKMREERDPILIALRDDNEQVYAYKNIFYRNSRLLVQLRFYPYIQLSIIGIFGLITFAVFNYSRSSEQNRVWVGLAKETAHQLGTPLSSLMAWTEYFKETFPDQKEIFLELQKDVDRLEMITERFSNIGSIPQMQEENVYKVVEEVISYLQKRISKKVIVDISSFPSKEIDAYINRPLFAWVVENIVKNAVDAMEGRGHIHIKILKVNEGKVAVDISDTGKGIPKSKLNHVFRPGFTTKKRGWGLGLALTQRIIDNYHGGKIYVKESEINRGTTFRILLKT